MSLRHDVLPALANISGVVYIIALIVAAIVALARLPSAGSWVLVAGTVLQVIGFSLFWLRWFGFPVGRSEAAVASYVSLNGLGRLLVVVSVILLVVRARSLLDRARAMERVAASMQGAGPPPL